MNLAWVHSPLWLVINSLVAFRLTRLWLDDQLPPLPLIRERLTAWADQRYRTLLWGEDSTLTDEQATERMQRDGGQAPITYLLSCYWCAGFWIGLAVVLAASLIPLVIWTVPAVALAFSATTGILAKITK
ncbi:MAG TPA: DUF1360 domain-containing protein [Gemmatimonadales bacterium]|nr:DUF1360 domain-containing protein [Gemmatimonadales bacterium]